LFLLWFRLFSFISLVRITSSCDRRVWGGGGGRSKRGDETRGQRMANLDKKCAAISILRNKAACEYI